jgi:hypothetical protein
MFNQNIINMFYKFNNKSLQCTKVNFIKTNLKWLIIMGAALFVVGLSAKPATNVENYSESEIKLIILKEQSFTKEKLIEKIKDLDFKCPHIVYAQALLETSNFQSQLFIENLNLFGMKEAKARINTAKGTQYSYAYYDSWMESLYDYALYSSRYLSAIKTESEYFDYLGQFYAQDDEYVSKLKDLIQREKVKELFATK